eukprot:4676605-Prymnesium_polylepis.1
MSRYHSPVMQTSLRGARAGLTQHVPIIDVQRDVYALIVGNLKEVARVELGLREALDVHELVHGSAIPYAPGVGLPSPYKGTLSRQTSGTPRSSRVRYWELPGKFGGGRA